MARSNPISPKIIETATEAAQDLFRRMESLKLRLVLAESCTAGLVSALVAGNAGASNCLCGSAVTYQNATKEKWLGINPQQILEHSAVSGPVTEAMARSVLFNTPPADFSVAVTGHLQSEFEPEGSLIWIAAATRQQTDFQIIKSKRLPLKNGTRIERQWEAAECVLHFALDVISGFKSDGSSK